MAIKYDLVSFVSSANCKYSKEQIQDALIIQEKFLILNICMKVGWNVSKNDS